MNTAPLREFAGKPRAAVRGPLLEPRGGNLGAAVVEVAPAVEEKIAALGHLRLVIMVSVTRREGGDEGSDDDG